jgi:dienelactone hydrolase
MFPPPPRPALAALCLLLTSFSLCQLACPQAKETAKPMLINRTFEDGTYIVEQRQLPNAPELTVYVTYHKDSKPPRPALIGWASPAEKAIAEKGKDLPPVTDSPHHLDQPLALSAINARLLERGCVLFNFTPRNIPWDPERPPSVWPIPNQAFAEFFTRWAELAPWDFGPVIDYIQTRKDVLPGRLGYIGGSTTAIIGAGLLAKEPRLTCAVLGAGSGYLKDLFEGWKRNKLWRSDDPKNWPETDDKLKTHDPILRADKFFPAALLMLNGGKDAIIPLESTQAFFEALYPHYAPDPDRLQLIIFAGAGHGWDQKWNEFLVLDWLDRYLLQPEPPKPNPRKQN